MTRHRITAAAVALGALALTGTLASPANAASAVSPQSLAGCPSGQVCVWDDGPFVGAPTVYGAPLFTNLNAGDHDEVSSWANKTRFTYCLIDFEADGTRVSLDVLSPGHSRGVLASGVNDRADAIQRCG